MSREGSHWACEPESAASWSNSGQAFQSLDQPDHRQRIPVTLEFELRKPFDTLVSAAMSENGWVNWSGLATLLSSLGPDLWPPFRRLLGEIGARHGGPAAVAQAVSKPIAAAAAACRSSRVTSTRESAPARAVAEVEATAR